MAMIPPYVTRQDDVLDALCVRFYGTSVSTLERVLDANPGLADQPPFLPEGVPIVFPDLPTPRPGATVPTQDLWS